MLVEDGVITKMFIEEDVAGDPFKVSDADTMLNHINPKAKEPSSVTVFTNLAALLYRSQRASQKTEPKLRRNRTGRRSKLLNHQSCLRKVDDASGVYRRKTRWWFG